MLFNLRDLWAAGIFRINYSMDFFITLKHHRTTLSLVNYTSLMILEGTTNIVIRALHLSTHAEKHQ